MAVLMFISAALRRRLAELRRPGEADRGDSPVPTAIIIVGLALLAVGVLAVASQAIDSWTALIPDAVEP